MTVQLGFLEPLEWDEQTQKDFSISRLGGLPVFSLAIFSLTELQTWPISNPPSLKDLECGTCSRQLRLLIQLYAPTEMEDMLRLIYVFLCKDGRCQKSG